MFLNGKLSELSNSVLVSVENGREQDNIALQNKVVEQINAVFASNKLDAAITTQKIELTGEYKKIAEENNISVGKAQLISKIQKINPNANYDIKELAALTVTELVHILDAYKDEIGVNVIGAASDKAYIDKSVIKSIVLDALAITDETLISNYRIHFDYEDGQMVYEVEFVYNNLEYEFEIGASSGEIIEYEYEKRTPVQAAGNEKTTEEIKQLSADEVNAAVDQLENFVSERDFEDGRDGRAVFEVEFVYDGKKYEIEFDAISGHVNKFSCKNDNVLDKEETEKIKAIVLKNADCTENDIFDYEIEEDGNIYEISFKRTIGNKTYEYEYEVTKTGTIISKEIDD